ncbi:hypothetical protein D8B26_008244 [Coccidioides posadasii str. Silveira]|uniref:Allantoin permease n=3 Tax=Coccidioides posadasii TaxID=199306 RepID=E9DGM5_COCPS|nr:Major Facilitator Superfamily protein [Coccidioides posadasii C735 delta SOWgp]EER25920.1 Major Facilitator Superfamily protein [Coccidioides posadasii C735 delta SOWgp]EFW14386.1 allantoin permease [Coccidioides posadasii str. Silveira]KMM69640.1 allantoin permease [Coccidioides posadasii RMSCC 3488]QVM13636.1 hypothetical protein D8B26_008244 [Coccidioides posadasii str. Silveira]|eukprot:XP_003068065.1 Major Facilitator Superfamily protein [Coccidioides posadasii C735 delta SOWgp]
MSAEKEFQTSVVEETDSASRVDPSKEADAQDVLLIDASEEELRRVRWKVDLILMPLLSFCYMLQFLDKQTLNFSTLLGILEDTKLQGSEYSWTAAIFYFGYLLWSYPTTYFAVRTPIGKYLSITVLLWAVVVICHAACKNFAGLMVVRFMLGVTESAVAPGFSLITGMWYTRREQPLRHGIWFTGSCCASLFGGVLAYAIGHITGALSPWRYLFIIFGAVTALWGVVLLVFLPDRQSNAIWLNARERKVAVRRVMENKQGIKQGKYQIYQVVEAFKDPINWCLFLYCFCVNIANGGLTAFGSLVIQGFGYEGLSALLIQMPTGAAQIGFVIASSLACTYWKGIRTVVMLVLCLISLVGMVLMYALDPANRSGRLAGFCLSLAFSANMPLGLSLVASNVGGFTKKAVVNACVFVMYCVGNVVGPQFFSVDEAPRYSRGLKASLSGFALGAFFLLLLGIYMKWENMRRDRKYGKVDQQENNPNSEDELLLSLEDKTDWEMERTFRYLL